MQTIAKFLVIAIMMHFAFKKKMYKKFCNMSRTKLEEYKQQKLDKKMRFDPFHKI